ncbi:MAG TPA: ABC transporter permease [Burkholderiaceae bacterium]|nr:ABC transporter permease [Burkholderiaceae bacterium]
MPGPASNDSGLEEIPLTTWRWLVGWWRIVHFGAQLLVLTLSPSTYVRQNRAAVASRLYLDTAPILPWFTVLAALICLVIIRIVLVTSVSYGLSQYALEMVVRVLVLELIPLAAAAFAALRCTIPNAADLIALRDSGHFDAMRASGAEPLVHEVLPRVAAGVFATLMLVALSSVVTLLLAYVSVYGFISGGFDNYTHTVGQVFDSTVSLIFGVKALLLSIAVAVLPIASVLYEGPRVPTRTTAEVQSLLRSFSAILLIEGASLAGTYY